MPPETKNSVFDHLYQTVEKVPYGKVVSYGQVAAQAGYGKRAARMVGWALRALPATSTVPWHRVVNREGVLTIINPKVDAREQKERLEQEGVGVMESQGRWQVPQQYFLQEW